jgi:hypothetical protein
VTLDGFVDELNALWHQYGPAALAGAGAVGLVALFAFMIAAKVRGKNLRPSLIWASANAALLLNAEGMYEVLTEMKIPAAFVWLVFAVFEIMLLNAEAQVAQRYKATTVREAGEGGKVVKAGEPGPMLPVVWALALISGVIVATNAGSATEAILRLALPVMVVWMWWGTLTAEGYTKRRSRFAFAPTRLAERAGILVAEADDDLAQLERDRKVRRMAALVEVIDLTAVTSRRHKRAVRRFRKQARTATPQVVAELAAQVDRSRTLIAQFVHVVDPAGADQPVNGALAVGRAPQGGGKTQRALTRGQVPELPAGRHAAADDTDQVEVGEVLYPAGVAPGRNQRENWLPLSELPGLPEIDPALECRCHNKDATKFCGQTLAEHVQRRGRYVLQIMNARPDWAEPGQPRIGKVQVKEICGIGSSGIQNEIGWLFDQLTNLAKGGDGDPDPALIVQR